MNQLICFLLLALPAPTVSAQPASPTKGLIVVQAESGKFTGIIDRHSCWHNVMLTDAPHSTHSGTALVDTKNETLNPQIVTI